MDSDPKLVEELPLKKPTIQWTRAGGKGTWQFDMDTPIESTLQYFLLQSSCRSEECSLLAEGPYHQTIGGENSYFTPTSWVFLWEPSISHLIMDPSKPSKQHFAGQKIYMTLGKSL